VSGLDRLGGRLALPLRAGLFLGGALLLARLVAG